MKIEKISIDKIKPYENNAKLHPPEQIEQIKKSIQEFGNNDPIAIDENGVIIEGHGRYEALKELGFKEIEVIRLSHLSEQQKKAYSLIHNKLTMNTDFDYNILDSELAYINEIDMSVFGFELSISGEDFDTEFSLTDDEKPSREQITFVLQREQLKFLENAMDKVKNEMTEIYEEASDKGNALYAIVKEWTALKGVNYENWEN